VQQWHFQSLNHLVRRLIPEIAVGWLLRGGPADAYEFGPTPHILLRLLDPGREPCPFTTRTASAERMSLPHARHWP